MKARRSGSLVRRWCQTFNYLFLAFRIAVVIVPSLWPESLEFITPVRFTM